MMMLTLRMTSVNLYGSGSKIFDTHGVSDLLTISEGDLFVQAITVELNKI